MHRPAVAAKGAFPLYHTARSATQIVEGHYNNAIVRRTTAVAKLLPPSSIGVYGTTQLCGPRYLKRASISLALTSAFSLERRIARRARSITARSRCRLHCLCSPRSVVATNDGWRWHYEV